MRKPTFVGALPERVSTPGMRFGFDAAGACFCIFVCHLHVRCCRGLDAGHAFGGGFQSFVPRESGSGQSETRGMGFRYFAVDCVASRSVRFRERKQVIVRDPFGRLRYEETRTRCAPLRSHALCLNPPLLRIRM